MRYVLIDYMHLAHRCIVAEPLSVTVPMNGEIQVVDTTIPNYTIKNIFSYGGRGLFHTGVFFEGGSDYRKNHFSKEGSGDGSGYKGDRSQNKGSFYTGIQLAIQLLSQGKVSLYRASGYEADDLIYSMVLRIKEEDKTTPIDIITNDSDLLPLVDEQVSVYIRGTREYNEDGCPTRRLYYQVTPRSWDEYLSYASAYKNFTIPYNSMLLFKMIRGDKSDNVSGACKGYGGKKYSELMGQMQLDKVDFPNVFRYGNDFDTVMKPVLDKYFKEDEVARMKFIYEGIGLRKLPEGQRIALPKQIDKGYLQQVLDFVKINLK